MSYPATEPVTITVTGGSFNGTISGHITHNVQPPPRFRAHVDLFKAGDTVAMRHSGLYAGALELSFGDTGTVTHVWPDTINVKFWRHPDTTLLMPVECLRYVEP